MIVSRWGGLLMDFCNPVVLEVHYCVVGPTEDLPVLWWASADNASSLYDGALG